jgi:nicotinamidase-related amidase
MDEHTEPHFDTSALLVIDVQADFLQGGTLPIPGSTRLIPRLAALIAAYRQARRPVAFVVRYYVGEDVDRVRRARVLAGEDLVRPGSPGSLVPTELLGATLDHELLLTGRPEELGPNEAVFFKPRWSAFHRTDLDAWLRRRGVDTVVVSGLTFPNCLRSTIYDATELDYRVVAAVESSSEVTPERIADIQRLGVATLSNAEIAAGVGSLDRT